MDVSNYTSKVFDSRSLTDITMQQQSYSNQELGRLDSSEVFQPAVHDKKTAISKVDSSYQNTYNQRDTKSVKHYDTRADEDFITSHTVEKETEIILLDKHYRALLRSEKEEMERKFHRQVA